jgi:hypothetical protein
MNNLSVRTRPPAAITTQYKVICHRIPFFHTDY